MSRVALYTRVSTDRQTTENQLAELRQWAERAGHEVVAVYEDKGISGAKGRDKRPAFDRALKGCNRREFDILAVWSSDRLGRSLPHLVDVLETIRSTNVGLYIHTQALDTTTPSGRALFGMLGVFAELERELIRERVNAGLARARREGKRLGRPRGADYTPDAIRSALLDGKSVREAAAATGASRGTVGSIRKALLDAGQLSA